MPNYVVCQLRDDGGVTVTAVAGGTREAAEVWAAKNGGEVLSADLHEAIARGDRPPGGGVTIGEFKLAIAPAYLAVASKDAATQAKWDRVFALLASNPNDRVVYPAEQPLAGILLLAVADGLLTAGQAAAVGVAVPAPARPE